MAGTKKIEPIIKNRPFLKWAGGKFRLTENINKLLPKKKCLLEPFVGAGSVFLNSNFEHYILGDLNQDLIDLFNTVKQQPHEYIIAAKTLFEQPKANSEAFYYVQRERFNQEKDPFVKSVLFLYLNRFGYNGLCRYNSKHQFNVPFGSYVKPYFPEKELRFFSEKAQRATFLCLGFEETLQLVNHDTVVYCDPPYAPLSQVSNFTHYAANGFSLEQQEHLAELARNVSQQHQTSVLISNHDTPYTRKIYQGARFRKLKVHRSISQSGKQRTKVNELIALFQPQKN